MLLKEIKDKMYEVVTNVIIQRFDTIPTIMLSSAVIGVPNGWKAIVYNLYIYTFANVLQVRYINIT